MEPCKRRTTSAQPCQYIHPRAPGACGIRDALTHRGDVDEPDAEVAEAAGVAAVAVGKPGPLLQQVEGAMRLAERRQRPGRSSLRRVASQLAHLLL
ncbi:hypothetical protein GUJ93_ZPchr0003g18308 [Zizania palustris]|uniref:Uncharacterized protein n=1 Tax=Zizania palustris TaxID=103762 RepID=A0A8J5S7H4_ZIZPA|nr:hypothetical protein GUJ93_ZPchr0003g18308 [Zizania palustris]